MKSAWAVFSAVLLVGPLPCSAQEVEKVTADTPGIEHLPDDLFRLTPGSWQFAKQLWQGDEPCTATDCEAGYTSGDLVVSVRREKTTVRVTAGFRGCKNVAWNDYEIGDKASGSDSRTIKSRIKKTVATSAKYCKVTAPAVAELDARQLFPATPPPAQP